MDNLIFTRQFLFLHFLRKWNPNEEILIKLLYDHSIYVYEHRIARFY